MHYSEDKILKVAEATPDITGEKTTEQVAAETAQWLQSNFLRNLKGS